MPDSGWAEWSQYVLKELERLNKVVDQLDKKLDSISNQLAVQEEIVETVSGRIAVVVSSITGIIVALLIKFVGKI